MKDEGRRTGSRHEATADCQELAANSQQPSRPIIFLLPSIHGQPTGGNVYNQQLLAHLPVPAEAIVYDPAAQNVPMLPLETAVLVDSLLTQHPEALQRLRERYPSARLVLLVHYLHLGDPQGDAGAARRERALLPLFDGFIATSTYTQAVLVREGVPPAESVVVWPGLDAAYRTPLPERPSRSAPRLLTVANHLPGKGLIDLVDGLETLADVGWTWTLIGGGDLAPVYSQRLRARVSASPVVDRITLVPPRTGPDLRAAYDAADVFVLPSCFETLSMATREAMARGLPVGAYAVGGLQDSISGPDVGCLVPPGDAQAFTHALRELIEDETQRQRLGAAARQASAGFPDWSASARKLLGWLREAG